MTENVEAKGRPDEVVAAEALETYKKRNDSFLVDLCSGQFRSTVRRKMMTIIQLWLGLS